MRPSLRPGGDPSLNQYNAPQPLRLSIILYFVVNTVIVLDLMALNVSLNDFWCGCHFSGRTQEIQSISGHDEGLGSKTAIDPIDA